MVQEQTSFKVAEVEVSYKPNYNITERSKINGSQDNQILCNNGNQKERYNKTLISYI